MAALVNDEWIAAVASTWEAVSRLHPEVGSVRLALGHQGGRGHRWAHYRANDGDVADELYLSYELQTWSDGAAVAGVLVHEATHALAHARQVVDCTSQGRWHNDRFQQLAAETGLMLSAGRAANLGADKLNPAAAHYYAKQIRRLEAAASAGGRR